ncbi:hypothetical protein HAZT_HAZT001080 [Hyalella azteca]|uniref:Uncharacterized protein n=1 Tax=Hyalella azteca TaxID=294128 RepID=A0A6A0H6F1_HYAAZ|nr:hypothetical protein HAZT_HAZT001080 [Hyalella azteca]
MFQQLSTKSGSFNDLLDLEESIRVEEEDLEHHCCCFRNNLKLSKQDENPKKIVRYYKRSDGGARDSSYDNVSQTKTETLQQRQPLLSDVPTVFASSEDNRLDDDEDVESTTTFSGCLKTPFIQVIDGPKTNFISSSNENDVVKLEIKNDSLAQLQNDPRISMDSPPRTIRSQSLKYPSHCSKSVSFSFSSHPSSPVFNPRCPINESSSSPSKSVGEDSSNLRCSHSMIGAPFFSSSQSYTGPRKSSNTSVGSQSSALLSVSHITKIMPSTRLVPATELPPVGRMRRVFTSHVRRRKKNKPSAISFHLSNMIKEPLRVVRSVPLTFPAG